MNDQTNRYSDLTAEVLSVAKAQILIQMRFLDRALFELKPKENMELPLATEGSHLFYQPRALLHAYRQEQSFAIRVWGHMLMHCLFRHMFVSNIVDEEKWNLSCDMAAEAVLISLNLRQLRAQSGQSEREKVLETIAAQVKLLSAERIYRYLLNAQLPKETFDQWRQLFFVDDHVLWYRRRKATPHHMSTKGGNNQQTNTTASETAEQEMTSDPESPQTGNEDFLTGEMDSQHGKTQGNEREQHNSSSTSGADSQYGTAADRQASHQMPDRPPDVNTAALCSMWKEISEHLETDLETFAKQQGIASGNLAQQLRALNREKCDYREFLRKFATRTEVMRLYPDEFDYVFYTYGLNLYRDMPLIEPLEYREDKRIRDFVIAIDTSGSVRGELVQKFIQKTFTILKQEETFDKRFNLHMIQCDEAIQEAVVITTQEEFDEYLENMTIKGLGGTDFRPVFSYVEQLKSQGAFRDLRGLLYFTDGYGIFPDKQTDYLTAFIFVDDEAKEIKVPSWAIRVIMETQELETMCISFRTDKVNHFKWTRRNKRWNLK